MNKRILILAAIFFLCLFAAHARGNSEEELHASPDQTQEPRLVQAGGVVRLVGTGLFNDIVITADDTEWYVTPDEKSKLLDLQHRRVTVEADEIVVELLFASGMSAGKRRILSNVRVLKIE